MAHPATIDEYIRSFPADVRAILTQIRRTIRSAVPDAAECISYRMPAFKRDGIVVFFAAFKQHIGLYPPVTGNAALVKAAARYAGEKGNLRFPFDRPIPYGLIGRIAKHNARQNRSKAAARSKKHAAVRRSR
jgi:uncharacterized protein YdhG (YjbR/CyaY superfamily)